jgi:ankyrin repeat protein
MGPEGETVLHLAVGAGDSAMVQLLFEKGADGEAVDTNGVKPLFLAVKSGNVALVDLLIKYKVNVESINEKLRHTAFYQAIENESEAVAELLLDNGADIDANAPNGHTALFSAVINGNLEPVTFLLRRGANKKIELEDG